MMKRRSKVHGEREIQESGTRSKEKENTEIWNLEYPSGTRIGGSVVPISTGQARWNSTLAKETPGKIRA
jgi:hypothetical protein